MKCTGCGREIVLSRVCPYCGAKNTPNTGDEKPASGKVSGSFRGRLEREPGSKPRLSRLVMLLRYIVDPRVSLAKKALLAAAGLYLLSPVDLLPFIPLLSGLDDLVLLIWVWRWLAGELRRYELREGVHGGVH